MMIRKYFLNVFAALACRGTVMDDKERDLLSGRLRREERQKCSAEIAGYQTLTENLRERLSEAEAAHKQEMADLHACYKQQVEKLKEELKQANTALGRECMSKSMLEKTNNTLSDLCFAMAGGDADKIASCAETYDWNSTIARIAQYHLNVLRRKTDLESRLASVAIQDNFNFE